MKRSIGNEIRRRLPKIFVNVTITFFFWIIGVVAPRFVEGIQVPGINISPYNKASWLLWAITTMVQLIFLIKALSDTLVLVDVGTDVIIKRFGVEEERSFKRVIKDIVYILLTFILTAAIVPLSASLPQIGGLLSTILSLGTLTIFFLLIYDVGRVVYSVIKNKGRIIANRLAKFIEQMLEDRENVE